MRLMGHYHLVPTNLRNKTIELNASDFFPLNHNAMIDEFYFFQNNVPRPPAPWIRCEGPRKVNTNGNGVLIGRFDTYRFGETQIKVTLYTSTVQEVLKFFFLW